MLVRYTAEVEEVVTQCREVVEVPRMEVVVVLCTEVEGVANLVEVEVVN